MSSARLPPRARSRPAGRRRRWRGAIRYALRALVLVACVATFVAAGGERWRRVAVAFDWHGVVLPANFRVDAWVIPPPYTGKPPVVLPGIHPGETAALPARSGIVAVPVNSTLVVRSTGKADLEVTSSGGVAASKDDVKAPAGTEEHRFSIGATGSATLRGAGDDLTWAFNAIPDTPPKIELTKDPERQAARLADAVLSSRGRLRRQRSAGDVRPQGRRRGVRRGSASALRPAGFPAGAAAGAHQKRQRPDHQGPDRSSVGRRRSADDADRQGRRRQ